MLGFESDCEGAGCFFRVAGSDVEEIGHGAVEGCELDGLVGWPVFAGADGVVGGDVDYLQLLEGSHSHAWCCILRRSLALFRDQKIGTYQIKHEEA